MDMVPIGLGEVMVCLFIYVRSIHIGTDVSIHIIIRCVNMGLYVVFCYVRTGTCVTLHWHRHKMSVHQVEAWPVSPLNHKQGVSLWIDRMS